MTLCIAIESPSGVVVASDSFFGNERTSDRIDRPKWFRAGPLFVAFAGDPRAAQIAQHSVKPRKRARGESVDAYLFSYASAIREAHRAHHDSGNDAETEFIVICEGRAYEIQQGYSVTRSRRGFCAIGAGSSEAIAALYVTRDVEPVERARRVMRAVARVSNYVRAPFYVEAIRC